MSEGARGRGRDWFFVFAAAMALVAFAYLIPPTLFEGVDWLQLHLLNKVYASEALLSGRLPLWNPYVALGRPFLADVETAVLYPPNLLYLLLDPSTALLLLTIGHYALGLVGMRALCRALGIREWAAWLAGASFLWSGPLVARLSLGQVPYVHATTYMPLLFLLALRLQDAFSIRRLAVLALALALQLVCGHPQIAWVTWLGIGFFLVGRALPPTPRPLREGLVGVASFGLALGAGLALSAPVLLPFFELVTQGNRSAPSLAFSNGGSLEWWQWTSLALPDSGRHVFVWEANLYGGLLPAVAGLAGLSQVGDRNVRGLLATGLAGALVALGTRTPAFALLYALLPGLSSFHLHSRAAVLVVLALVVSAALGLSRPASRRRTAVLLGLGALLVGLGPAAFRTFSPHPDASPQTFPGMRLLLALAAGLLAGLTLHLAPGRRLTLARVGLAVLVTVELGVTLTPGRRAWFIPTVRQGERPLHEGLLRAGLYGRTGVPPRVVLPPWSIRENAGVVYKWSNVAGYNALTLDRVWLTLHETLGLTPPLDENTYPSRQIYDAGPFPYGTMNLVAGWQVLGPSPRGGEPWRPAPGRPVLRRPEDPRVFLSPSVKRVEDWREAVSSLAAGHDAHRLPLVEDDMGLPEGEIPGVGPGRAEIVSFEPEHVGVETEASRPSLLVLSEAWYPGWTASVDGQVVPTRPANAWMRSVPVPAGRHQVDVRFRSRWLLAGVLVFLVTAVGLAGAVFWERRRTR